MGRAPAADRLRRARTRCPRCCEDKLAERLLGELVADDAGAAGRPDAAVPGRQIAEQVGEDVGVSLLPCSARPCWTRPGGGRARCTTRLRRAIRQCMARDALRALMADVGPVEPALLQRPARPVPARPAGPSSARWTSGAVGRCWSPRWTPAGTGAPRRYGCARGWRRRLHPAGAAGVPDRARPPHLEPAQAVRPGVAAARGGRAGAGLGDRPADESGLRRRVPGRRGPNTQFLAEMRWRDLAVDPRLAHPLRMFWEAAGRLRHPPAAARHQRRLADSAKASPTSPPEPSATSPSRPPTRGPTRPAAGWCSPSVPTSSAATRRPWSTWSSPGRPTTSTRC